MSSHFLVFLSFSQWMQIIACVEGAKKRGGGEKWERNKDRSLFPFFTFPIPSPIFLLFPPLSKPAKQATVMAKNKWEKNASASKKSLHKVLINVVSKWCQVLCLQQPYLGTVLRKSIKRTYKNTPYLHSCKQRKRVDAWVTQHGALYEVNPSPGPFRSDHFLCLSLEGNTKMVCSVWFS